ncbi:nmrA-like family protein [Aspergillus avenaceus]|uniref:NmrA-like family protein n=1 Tax=Aspergillus avenaceus TaxID=36643 RepID=A0A5N6U4Z0_ASPAV|nr:nmrA-like family protein [Aspergillus avenaceus]
MDTITVGIAGITGKFGRCILARLLRNPGVKIRGYCRQFKNLPIALLHSDNVQIIKGQSDDLQKVRTFVTGCDVVICCYLGAPALMVDGQKVLIDACELEGVPRYIASDYSLDYTKLEYGQIPPKDAMKDILAYLETKKVEGVHVMIGAFMETLLSPFLGMYHASSHTLNYWGAGDEPWEVTTYQNAADFVASVALDRDAVGFHRFIGDSKSIRQIAEAFEEVYGRKPGLNQYGDMKDLYSRLEELRQKDPSNIFSYLGFAYQYYAQTGQTAVLQEPETAGVTVPHVTFEDFFRRHTLESIPSCIGRVGSNLAL